MGRGPGLEALLDVGYGDVGIAGHIEIAHPGIGMVDGTQIEVHRLRRTSHPVEHEGPFADQVSGVGETACERVERPQRLLVTLHQDTAGEDPLPPRAQRLVVGLLPDDELRTRHRLGVEFLLHQTVGAQQLFAAQRVDDLFVAGPAFVELHQQVEGPLVVAPVAVDEVFLIEHRLLLAVIAFHLTQVEERIVVVTPHQSRIEQIVEHFAAVVAALESHAVEHIGVPLAFGARGIQRQRIVKAAQFGVPAAAHPVAHEGHRLGMAAHLAQDAHFFVDQRDAARQGGQSA